MFGFFRICQHFDFLSKIKKKKKFILTFHLKLKKDENKQTNKKSKLNGSLFALLILPGGGGLTPQFSRGTSPSSAASDFKDGGTDFI